MNPVKRQQRHPPERRAQRHRLVAHAERRTTGQQDKRRPPGDRRLLEVEALQQVEQAEGQHQTDRHLPRPAAALEQVGSDQQQREPGRERERMEQPDRLDRLDLEEHVAAPADVRSQRRADVDDPDKCRRECSQTRQPA